MVSVADNSYHMFSRHMGSSEEVDFPLYPDPAQSVFMQQQPFVNVPNFDIDNNLYNNFTRAHAPFTAATGFSSNTIYTDIDPSVSSYALESPELRAGASSNYSTASGPSATSSVMGSPPSIQGHIASVPEWGPSGLGPNPGIVRFDSFSHNGNEYNFPSSGMEEFALDFDPVKPEGFVDPSILHPQYATRPSSATQPGEAYQAPTYPESPLSHLSHLSRSPRPAKQGSQSPYLNSHYNGYPYTQRRQSIQSYSSQDNFSGEESREKGRCTYPDCGKVFKDLKAHMLTHQNERPEKCPIQTCDYHTKGFARKYDKNRHTLTHYKGTMVCGFCPGSGSSHEKSFNRADVFKRHLTSVHAVEQTPPNSRKKTSVNADNGMNMPGYVSESSGKCSTCSATFSNAQDFYEHLDDCVLRIVQQEEPSEAVNAARLAEVEHDENVHETLRNNALPTTTTNVYFGEEELEDNDMDDDNDEDFSLNSKLPRKARNNRTANGGVQKSRGLTHSKGGVMTMVAKGRKRRKDYPLSWGCSASQMKMRKRVLCVFDGPRRLWKDDMMVDTSGGETRVSLPDGKSYVTDLDVMTVRRADTFHNSTDAEKGPWLADDLTGLDVEKMLEIKNEIKSES